MSAPMKSIATETIARQAVQSYWEANPCAAGDWARRALTAAYFAHLSADRYRTHPYIPAFADFEAWRGCDILEIGVGAGADFCRWAAVSPRAVGIDLTAQGVALTQSQLSVRGLQARVERADAEHLPFPPYSFDLVYSFGVLHHTPDIRAALAEIWRVLRPGGSVRLMLYHMASWVTLQTWLAHGLAKGRPWASPRRLLAYHMESPGTQAYTRREAYAFCHQFTDVTVTPVLTTYDLWEECHRAGRAMRVVHGCWPRWLIRRLGGRFGWNLLVRGRKPEQTAH